MAKQTETDAEILKRASASRERARATAKESTRLLHEAARLEETVRHTEEQLKELKALVSNTRKKSSVVRERQKPERS